MRTLRLRLLVPLGVGLTLLLLVGGALLWLTWLEIHQGTAPLGSEQGEVKWQLANISRE